uniref:Uncharacterized protein n=1 Tax=Oryza glumipatula TaxID=40148 RepID=A0A0D9YWA0_9ORYZ
MFISQYINVYQLEEHGKAATSVGQGGVHWGGHGFALEPNDASGPRWDCVYFMHEKRTWLDGGKYRFLCRYSMEDGKVDRVVNRFLSQYINVYELEEHEEAAMMWAKVESVRVRMLFFDKYMHGFSLEPNDTSELRVMPLPNMFRDT